MAFIWKDKKSGSWYLDYTPEGGRRVRKRVGKSKQAAQMALKKVEYDLSFALSGVTTPNITLKDFFERYEQAMKPKLRPKSWARYRAIIDHFRKFSGGDWNKLKLQQLTREQFEQYVAWRKTGGSAFLEKNGNGARGAKSKTVNTELDILASIFNKAVEWKCIPSNPAKSIRRLKEDDRKPFRFFSLEEIELLRLVASLLDEKVGKDRIDAEIDSFKATHPELDLEVPETGETERKSTRWLRHGPIIVDFLLTTGVRESELLSLEWSWLDLKRKVVSLRRRSNWSPKGTERDIGLKDDIVKALKAIPRIEGQPRVFLGWNDNPLPARTFERGIQRLIKRCGIKAATLHDFRHTFASHLAMASVPLPTIQQILGHKDIQTVMIYAHLSPSHIQESVTALPF